ncbi:hypothetical protein D3C71_1106700 [compost metagenome]
MINFDQSALVELKTDQVQSKFTISVRTTSYSNKQVIRSNFFGFATNRIFHGNFLVVLYSTFSFSVSYDFDASFSHVFRNKTSHIFIKAWKYSIQTFDDCYFSTEFGVHLAKLSADVTTTDYDHALRNFWKLKSFSRRQNTSTEWERFQFNRTGTCSNDTVFEAVTWGFMIIEHTCFCVADKHAFAVKYFNFVAFHQASHAASHFLNYAVFELLSFGKIHFNVLSSNTENFTMLSRFELMCSSNQCFRRNTSTVQTYTAEFRFIHDEDFLAELSGTNCRHIPTRTCTNDQCVNI